MHHADVGAELVVDEFQRAIDDADIDQEIVHQAAPLQNDDPGEGAGKEAQPERNEEDYAHPLGEAGADIDHQIGKRIGEKRAEDRGQQGQLQREHQKLQIDRLGEIDIALERKPGLRTAAEAHPQEDEQRHDENRHHGDRRHDHQR
ncbi:hypothetical protein D3C71_1677250 [compost metagenome]